MCGLLGAGRLADFAFAIEADRKRKFWIDVERVVGGEAVNVQALDGSDGELTDDFVNAADNLNERRGGIVADGDRVVGGGAMDVQLTIDQIACHAAGGKDHSAFEEFDTGSAAKLVKRLNGIQA